jgi:hypothetical protein
MFAGRLLRRRQVRINKREWRAGIGKNSSISNRSRSRPLSLGSLGPLVATTVLTCGGLCSGPWRYTVDSPLLPLSTRRFWHANSTPFALVVPGGWALNVYPQPTNVNRDGGCLGRSGLDRWSADQVLAVSTATSRPRTG